MIDGVQIETAAYYARIYQQEVDLPRAERRAALMALLAAGRPSAHPRGRSAAGRRLTAWFHARWASPAAPRR